MTTQNSEGFIDRHGVKLTIFAVFLMFAIPTYIGWHALHRIDNVSSDNQDNIAKIEHERHERIETQKAINAYFCRSNNHQNGVLTGLLVYVVAASPPDASLTEEQRQGKEVFEHALAKLHKTDCGKLRIGKIKTASEATGK